MVRFNQPIIPKTADFTVDPSRTKCGTRFTNRGAGGSVQMTLPLLSSSAAEWIGYWVELQAIADQTIKIAVTAGRGVAFNNAACTSLAAQTGGQKIGSLLMALWDGTSWILQGESNGVTYTVA